MALKVVTHAHGPHSIVNLSAKTSMTLLHSNASQELRLALLTKKSSKKARVLFMVGRIWIAASLPVRGVTWVPRAA